jgi:phenylalanyl-tRNA synthetase beta chain
MRFSEAWLREWVNPDVDTATLADQLSMSGLEVDAVEPAAPDFTGVAVGLVLSVEPHPDAEKLRICRVEVGDGEPLQIICGAANVSEGMRVPLATVGARLPGDFKIKKAKLRGVDSFGMICSASELGLAESSDGIMPLPEDAPLGEDLRTYLSLDDHCIELDLTPDRSDCLSLAGIAREVSVINRSPLEIPEIAAVPSVLDDRFTVVLDAPQACPRYVCRIIRGIDSAAETPLWMQERLRRSGLRAISPVVDVTNYVLLELGQPMHGFDLAKLDRGVRVRMAENGERLVLLNGEEIELRADTLVIADEARPVALAGIMGGSETGVDQGTRDILLESAFFAPEFVSGKARSYGLHTDSSHRFERGVDPQLQARAMERATALLVGIAGGKPGPVVEVAAEARIPARSRLLLRRDRIRRVLGLELDDGAIEDILTRLGMEIVPAEEGWDVTAPSGRFDLGLEVDLIAEIGRIYGYTNIPISHATASAATKAPPETSFDLDRAKLVLVDRGYSEVITYSFVSPELQQKIEPGRPVLALANPLSADMSVMRTSLWPGLLQAARTNLARQQERVRIFETGLRFQQTDDGLRQDRILAGLLAGSAAPEQWAEPARLADFYDAKADLEAVLALTGASNEFRFLPGEHPALHPGQAARIERNGAEVGLLGMLHPGKAAEMDFSGNAYLLEVAIDSLEDGELPVFEPISKFPAIRRDLAIVVDADLPYDRVRDCVTAAASDLLRDLHVFDVYQGEKIDSGRKSLALGLILQASSQTLKDDDVEKTIGRVLERLKFDLGARLRD